MPTNTPIPTVSTGNVISAATINDIAVMNTCVGLLGANSSYGGSIPSANAPNFQVQGGSNVVAAGGGTGTVSFPNTFPGGLLTVFACAGDVTGTPGYVTISAGSTNAAGFTWVTSNVPTGSWRINWIAIGW